jgi:chromosome segregation ATPase
MIESVRIDLAAVITAVSLVITAAGTFIVSFRDKDNRDSNSKAISVTNISDTEGKVETLIKQVDFLFDEVSRLRVEKDTLERQIEQLTTELENERVDHANTKSKLDQLLVELADKNNRIAILEEQIKKYEGDK